MVKLLKKHYMPVLAILIFVSVFLWQFFYLIGLPSIQQYAYKDINYLNLLSYLIFVLLIVSLIYNIPLLLSLHLYQSFRIPRLRVTVLYNNKYTQLKSTILIVKRYQTFQVIRC